MYEILLKLIFVQHPFNDSVLLYKYTVTKIHPLSAEISMHSQSDQEHKRQQGTFPGKLYCFCAIFSATKFWALGIFAEGIFAEGNLAKIIFAGSNLHLIRIRNKTESNPAIKPGLAD